MGANAAAAPHSPDDGRLTARRAVLLALWLGLLAGLLQVVLVAFKRHVLGTQVLQTPQAVWMAPAMHTLLFLPLVALWLALGRRWPRAAGLATLAAVLAFLGAGSALMTLRIELRWWAILVLAAGLAVQLGRAAAAAPARVAAAARRSTPWMAAVVVVMGGWLNGTRAFAERRDVAALGQAPAGAPNVLLIILDTVRGLSLSLYGYERPTTPNLVARARESVVFDRAVAATSWSGPAHGALFTGQHPTVLSTDWGSGLDSTYVTLAEALRERGWLTGGFVANARYLSRSEGFNRGFVHYEGYRVLSLEAMFASTWLSGRLLAVYGWAKRRTVGQGLVIGKGAPEVFGPLLDWMPEQGDRPFFAMLNLMDAHEPYEPPQPWRSMFDSTLRRTLWDRIRDRLPGAPPAATSREGPEPAWLARERARYDGAIAYLDHLIGRLLDEMARRGQLDRTLVIVTADHGEELNEHDQMGHTKSLYWPSLHVPLLIRLPGRVPAGLRVTEPIGLRQVPATVMDLTGARGPAVFPGTPLARYWDGSPSPADTVYSNLTAAEGVVTRAPIGRGEMHSVVMGSLHLIRNGDGTEELYDVARDPFERNALLAEADSTVLATMRAILAAMPARQGEPRPRL